MNTIYGKYIVTNPKVLVGKPVIRGTRIPVDLLLKKLAEDVTVEEILKDYPRLTKKHLKGVLSYAHI